ncbi:hypothetical protein MIND_01050600 [Mycena indigotica]|uniref:Uncharacterized protein n=1 Tax=Mycena indigotica TaxID=2126181 RepID=A0A8H6SAG9_9AGAR|nr:uncharacterized protein MIND_01050600 [Mycena indigotica]KAF7295121.1 hypothetical protein MIND_01050600 [Mycena indigotica]
MALQTETSSSSTSDNIISSPPLILAFVAVAGLGFAIAIFICWRRWRPSQFSQEVIIRPTLESPKIWDLWSPLPSASIAPTWKGIQPMVVTRWHSPYSVDTASYRRLMLRSHQPQPRRLQVAVLIVLPLPNASDEILEYSIGSCSVICE